MHGTVGSASDSRARGPGFDNRPETYFRFPSVALRRAVSSYWRKYGHEVLVNR